MSLIVAAGQMQRVDDAGRRDDRGAVLVVMEHRNVHHLAQAFLDDETVRRLDVFQIDAAEAGAEIAHRVMNSSTSLVSTSRSMESTSAKRLKSTALPSITGLDGERAQIAQTQDGGAVGDHGHQIALGGIVVGQRRDCRRWRAPARPRPANRRGDRSRWVAIGLVGVISSLPGLGPAWKASASSCGEGGPFDVGHDLTAGTNPQNIRFLRPCAFNGLRRWRAMRRVNVPP